MINDKEVGKEIHTRIEEIAKEIKKLRYDTLDKTILIRDTDERIRKIESEAYMFINNAKDEKTGKHLYTNEKTRDAAYKLCLADHKDYNALIDRSKQLNDDVKRSGFDVEFLITIKDMYLKLLNG